MNREVVPMESPLATGTKALHDPSGTAVSPVRTLMSTVVPVGVSAVQLIASQSASAPASTTRDRKVPEVEYGDIRIQSTVTSSPPAEAATGRMFWAMVTFWVSTTWPSMENTTWEAPQSIRYRCGDPMKLPARGLSIEVDPSVVRACRASPLELKMAKGVSWKVLPKPMKEPPPGRNVAMNSTE